MLEFEAFKTFQLFVGLPLSAVVELVLLYSCPDQPKGFLLFGQFLVPFLLLLRRYGHRLCGPIVLHLLAGSSLQLELLLHLLHSIFIILFDVLFDFCLDGILGEGKELLVPRLVIDLDIDDFGD
jgi:hypothetical protein